MNFPPTGLATMRLLEPIRIGGVDAPNRLMFGPIVTNLANDDRSLSERHVAFYKRRAVGGCGIIVTEGASVTDDDWPYERAPLARRCAPGWNAIADACHAHGALAIASLDHAGGQGSSAYSQRPLMAPSRVPEVNSREVPKWMEPDDIDAVIAGFANATRLAVAAGMDGVEINAGQHSVIRQFMSGLTNHRDDIWADRLLVVQRVIDAVRRVGGVVGLRLCADELAPWSGITPEIAGHNATNLGSLVDYIVVVRGSIYSVEKTRPDVHEPAGFNVELCRAIRTLANTTVVLQGSVVDPDMAERAITDGTADVVEMTRAQLADPDLGVKIRAGTAPRPCVRCNQTCQVRDVRNPIITCIGEPTTGYETTEPEWQGTSAQPRQVTIVGGGVAGMEAARVAAARGHNVAIVEASSALGGMAAAAGPGGPLVAWLEQQCRQLGVIIETGRTYCTPDATTSDNADAVVVQATGGRRGEATYVVDADATTVVVDIGDLRRGFVDLPQRGTVVVWDPIGGPIAVALAEELGQRAVLVTPDLIAGNELSRTGDLAPANVRLQQRQVTIRRRALVRRVSADSVVVEDRWTGEQQSIAAVAFVDCGFRLPTEPIDGVTLQIGDCVAPRTIAESILEARRVILALDRNPPTRP